MLVSSAPRVLASMPEGVVEILDEEGMAAVASESWLRSSPEAAWLGTATATEPTSDSTRVAVTATRMRRTTSPGQLARPVGQDTAWFIGRWWVGP